MLHWPTTPSILVQQQAGSKTTNTEGMKSGSQLAHSLIYLAIWCMCDADCDTSRLHVFSLFPSQGSAGTAHGKAEPPLIISNPCLYPWRYAALWKGRAPVLHWSLADVQKCVAEVHSNSAVGAVAHVVADVCGRGLQTRLRAWGHVVGAGTAGRGHMAVVCCRWWVGSLAPGLTQSGPFLQNRKHRQCAYTAIRKSVDTCQG